MGYKDRIYWQEKEDRLDNLIFIRKRNVRKEKNRIQLDELQYEVWLRATLDFFYPEQQIWPKEFNSGMYTRMGGMWMKLAKIDGKQRAEVILEWQGVGFLCYEVGVKDNLSLDIAKGQVIESYQTYSDIESQGYTRIDVQHTPSNILQFRKDK
jgi:hypothetical protein